VLALAFSLLVVTAPLLVLGGWPERVWLGAALGYVTVLVLSALVATLRFRSVQVGALALLAFPVTHAVYAAALVRGVVTVR
jgi:hypothetical protein